MRTARTHDCSFSPWTLPRSTAIPRSDPPLVLVVLVPVVGIVVALVMPGALARTNAATKKQPPEHRDKERQDRADDAKCVLLPPRLREKEDGHPDRRAEQRRSQPATHRPHSPLDTGKPHQASTID